MSAQLIMVVVAMLLEQVVQTHPDLLLVLAELVLKELLLLVQVCRKIVYMMFVLLN